MKRAIVPVVLLTLVVALSGSTARAEAGSRVIVSNTLNDTLQFFDAATLQETQAPLVSKGTAPVRLTVAPVGAKTFLLSANHGVVGSVGVFDLSGDVVLETPLSPFSAGRLGSVGIAVGRTRGLQTELAPYVVVTNTHQALAGCGVPNGSATVFDGTLLEAGGVLLPGNTVPVAGAQPFAVETDGGSGVYVSSNCSDTVEAFTAKQGTAQERGLTLERNGSAATGDGPDGIAITNDPTHVYVANIGSSSVSVFAPFLTGGARTTVPVGRGPIEVVRADAASGRRWLITGNGGEGSISIIDRDIVDACIASTQSTCPATVATIPTGVPKGAPESVAFDAETNRVFVVNKTFPPSLSVIQLVEGPDGSVSGSEIGPIPLGALGSAAPVPSVIAFDVVVQPR